MTPDQRFSVLLILFTAVLGGVGWLLRSLLSVSQQWVRTGVKIEELTEDIRDLVGAKERDHDRMDGRIDRLEGRVERHDVWHSEHP